MAEEGHFLNAPDTYMDKIAVGPGARGAINIRKSATYNLGAIAEAKRVRVDDLTAVILDRPRHEALVAEVRKAGVRIRLISDGDVGGAMATADEATGIDVLLGTGGAPEGVLAAAALRCMGGDMQGVLKFRNDDERARATRMGITDLDPCSRSTSWRRRRDVRGHRRHRRLPDARRPLHAHGRADQLDCHALALRHRAHLETRHHFERHPVYDRGGNPRRPPRCPLERPCLLVCALKSQGRVAHLDRAPASGAGGSEFESRRAHLAV